MEPGQLTANPQAGSAQTVAPRTEVRAADLRPQLPVRQDEALQVDLATKRRTYDAPARIELIVSNYAFLSERESAHGQTLGDVPLVPTQIVKTTNDPLQLAGKSTKAFFELSERNGLSATPAGNLGHIVSPREQAIHFLKLLGRVSRDELERSQLLDQFTRLIYQYERNGMLASAGSGSAEKYLANFRSALAEEIKILHGYPEYAAPTDKYRELFEVKLALDAGQPFDSQALTHRAIVSWFLGADISVERGVHNLDGIERVRSQAGFRSPAAGEETGALGVCEIDGSKRTIHLAKSDDGKTLTVLVRPYDKFSTFEYKGIADPIANAEGARLLLKRTADEFSRLAEQCDPSAVGHLYQRFIESAENPYSQQIASGVCLNPAALREREKQFADGWLKERLLETLRERDAKLAAQIESSPEMPNREAALKSTVSDVKQSVLAWETDRLGYPTAWSQHRLVDRSVLERTTLNAKDVTDDERRRLQVRLVLEKSLRQVPLHPDESPEAYAGRLIAEMKKRPEFTGNDAETQARVRELTAAHADVVAVQRSRQFFETKASQLISLFSIADRTAFKKASEEVFSSVPMPVNSSEELRREHRAIARQLILELVKEQSPVVHAALHASVTPPGRQPETLADPNTLRVQQAVRGVTIAPIQEYASSIHTICGNHVFYGSQDENAPRLRYGAQIRRIEQLVLLGALDQKLRDSGRDTFDLSAPKLDKSGRWDYPQIFEPRAQADHLVKQLIRLAPGERAILWERFCAQVNDYYQQRPDPNVRTRVALDPAKATESARDFLESVASCIPDAVQKHRGETPGLPDDADIRAFVATFIGERLVPTFTAQELADARKPYFAEWATRLHEKTDPYGGVIGVYSTDRYSAILTLDVNQKTGAAKFELSPVNAPWDAIALDASGKPMPVRDEKQFLADGKYLSEFAVLARLGRTDEKMRLWQEYRDHSRNPFEILMKGELLRDDFTFLGGRSSFGRGTATEGVIPERIRDGIAVSSQADSFSRFSRWESQGPKTETQSALSTPVPAPKELGIIDQIAYYWGPFGPRNDHIQELWDPPKPTDFAALDQSAYDAAISAGKKEYPALAEKYAAWFDARMLADLDENTRKMVTSNSTLAPFTREQVGDPYRSYASGDPAAIEAVRAYNRHCCNRIVDYLKRFDLEHKSAEERRMIVHAVWANYGRDLRRLPSEPMKMDRLVAIGAVLQKYDPKWLEEAPVAQDPYTHRPFLEGLAPEALLDMQSRSRIYRGQVSARTMHDVCASYPQCQGSHFQEVLAEMKKQHEKVYIDFLCVSPADAYPFTKLGFINAPSIAHVDMRPVDEQLAAREECYQALANGLAFRLHAASSDTDLVREAYQYLGQVASVYPAYSAAREYDLLASVYDFGLRDEQVGFRANQFGELERQYLGDIWARQEAATFFKNLPVNVFRELRDVDANLYVRVAQQMKEQLTRELLQEKAGLRKSAQGGDQRADDVSDRVAGIDRAIERLQSIEISADPTKEAILPTTLTDAIAIDAPDMRRKVLQRLTVQRDEFSERLDHTYGIAEPAVTRREASLAVSKLLDAERQGPPGELSAEKFSLAQEAVAAETKHLRVLLRRLDIVEGQLFSNDELRGRYQPEGKDWKWQAGKIHQYVEAQLSEYAAVNQRINSALEKGTDAAALQSRRLEIVQEIKIWVGDRNEQQFIKEVKALLQTRKSELEQLAPGAEQRKAYAAEIASLTMIEKTWFADPVLTQKAEYAARLKQSAAELKKLADSGTPQADAAAAQLRFSAQYLQVAEQQLVEHMEMRRLGQQHYMETKLEHQRQSLEAGHGELSAEIGAVRASLSQRLERYATPIVERYVTELAGDRSSADPLLNGEFQLTEWSILLSRARGMTEGLAPDALKRKLETSYLEFLRKNFGGGSSAEPDSAAMLQSHFERAVLTAERLQLTSVVDQFKRERVNELRTGLDRCIAGILPTTGAPGVSDIQSRVQAILSSADTLGVRGALLETCERHRVALEPQIAALRERARELPNPAERSPIANKAGAMHALSEVLDLRAAGKVSPAAPVSADAASLPELPSTKKQTELSPVRDPKFHQLTDPVGVSAFWNAWDNIVDHRTSGAKVVEQLLAEWRGTADEFKEAYEEHAQTVDVLQIRDQLLQPLGGRTTTATEAVVRAKPAERDYARRIAVMVLIRETVGDKSPEQLQADPQAREHLRAELGRLARRESEVLIPGDSVESNELRKSQKLIVDQLRRACDWYSLQTLHREFVDANIAELAHLEQQRRSERFGASWDAYFHGDPNYSPTPLLVDWYSSPAVAGTYAGEAGDWLDGRKREFTKYMIADVSERLRERSVEGSPEFNPAAARMYHALVLDKPSAVYGAAQLVPGADPMYREMYFRDLARAFVQHQQSVAKIITDAKDTPDPAALKAKYQASDEPWLYRLVDRVVSGQESPNELASSPAAAYLGLTAGGFRQQVGIPLQEFYQQGRLAADENLVTRLSTDTTRPGADLELRFRALQFDAQTQAVLLGFWREKSVQEFQFSFASDFLKELKSLAPDVHSSLVASATPWYNTQLQRAEEAYVDLRRNCRTAERALGEVRMQLAADPKSEQLLSKKFDLEHSNSTSLTKLQEHLRDAAAFRNFRIEFFVGLDSGWGAKELQQLSSQAAALAEQVEALKAKLQPIEAEVQAQVDAMRKAGQSDRAIELYRATYRIDERYALADPIDDHKQAMHAIGEQVAAIRYSLQLMWPEEFAKLANDAARPVVADK